MLPQYRRLAVLLGTMYFVQGVGEPGDGLLAQPMLGLMKSWQRTPEQIATFAALLGVPWAIKPLYGLLTDCVPLAGYRRKSYLVAAGALATLGFLAMTFLPLEQPSPHLLLACLLVPALGVAVADVVIDALMVEYGQPAGITGNLQSIQWAALCVASIVTGVAGGHLNQHGMVRVAFLVCALLSGAMCWVAVTLEEPRRIETVSKDDAPMTSQRPRAWRTMAAVVAVVVLWHFNPFSNAVLYLYMTGPLEMSETFYGANASILAAGSLAACAVYAMYCRAMLLRTLVHLSIAAGVASTLGYLGLVGERSAYLVSALMGFASMTATLALLDATARTCPPSWSGTVFAGIMASANASAMLATHCGGMIYQRWGDAWGPETAFRAVVLLGALTTAACWLFVPFLVSEEEPQMHTDEHG